VKDHACGSCSIELTCRNTARSKITVTCLLIVNVVVVGVGVGFGVTVGVIVDDAVCRIHLSSRR
jgi:hypothetical protein